LLIVTSYHDVDSCWQHELDIRQPRAGKPEHNTFVTVALVVVLNAHRLFTQALICLTWALAPFLSLYLHRTHWPSLLRSLVLPWNSYKLPQQAIRSAYITHRHRRYRPADWRWLRVQEGPGLATKCCSRCSSSSTYTAAGLTCSSGVTRTS